MHACGEGISHLTLPAVPCAVGWSRRHAESSLQAWQLTADTVETAKLIVSELVTNAVRSRPEAWPATTPLSDDPAPTVTLVLWLMDSQVGIQVSDSHPGWPAAAAADPHAETGRGLLLVQAVAKEWDCLASPDGGKAVYASITAPEARRPSTGHDPWLFPRKQPRQGQLGSQPDAVLADARRFVAATVGAHLGMPTPLLIDLACQSRRHLVALVEAFG